MSMNISSQLISKLGSANSLLPLATKDIVNSASNTYFSYKAGGDIECKDRLVDEIGTGAIWLFGIPTYKKVIDNTIYKLAKISPDVDIRILKNKKQLKSAIQNAPTEKIKKEIMQVAKNASKTKKLSALKFGLSLSLTMLSYLGITKFKQNMTKKNIEKEFIKNKQKTNNNYQIDYNTNPIFNEIENKKINVSFGNKHIVKLAEDIMLNPVKNMLVLDSCISGERLVTARNNNEKKEIIIKEGSFLFFVYCAGELIKKSINKLSEKVFNVPIELDAKFLDSNLANKLLKNKKLQKEVSAFLKLITSAKSENEIYNFILQNQNNSVVKAAKKSGLIKTVKDKAGNIKIDTRKYIDLKEISKLTNNLEKFIKKGKATEIKKYLAKIKSIKTAGTLINIGICCLTLGFITPKLMYKERAKNQNGNSNFHVKTEYEKELMSKY